MLQKTEQFDPEIYQRYKPHSIWIKAGLWLIATGLTAQAVQFSALMFVTLESVFLLSLLSTMISFIGAVLLIKGTKEKRAIMDFLEVAPEMSWEVPKLLWDTRHSKTNKKWKKEVESVLWTFAFITIATTWWLRKNEGGSFTVLAVGIGLLTVSATLYILLDLLIWSKKDENAGLVLVGKTHLLYGSMLLSMSQLAPKAVKELDMQFVLISVETQSESKYQTFLSEMVVPKACLKSFSAKLIPQITRTGD